MKIFVVLPAYNESENVPALLNDLVKLKEIGETLCAILVDDGSTDGTAETAKQFTDRLEIVVEKHPRNLGLGAAIRTGLNRAIALCGPDDAIVTLDADQSHPVSLIPAMREKIEQGFDAVIASRYAPGGKEVGLALHRKLFSRSCSLLFRLFRPVQNVRDYTCGFRMIRSEKLRRAAAQTQGRFFRENGFACMCELLLNLSRLNTKFAETPLTLRYDLKKGKSKMKVAETICQYLRVLSRA